VSAARIHGFTQENVDLFYSIFEPEMVNIKFSPNHIFNMDETGITIVQQKSSKVVGVKGKRQVASLSSAERGALVTVVNMHECSQSICAPAADLPQEEYEIKVVGWRTSWHDWYLSHLWLDPGRVIYAVVQALCFYRQTYD
jgi:hypothetical protein